MDCIYCRRDMERETATHPTRDHVVPKSKGGIDTVWACYQCNNIKGCMMPDEWELFMADNPRWWETRPVTPPLSFRHPFGEKSILNEWKWLGNLARTNRALR